MQKIKESFCGEKQVIKCNLVLRLNERAVLQKTTQGERGSKKPKPYASIGEAE